MGIIQQGHQKYKKKFIIVAGARGYENSVLLKRSNYFIVYLDAPQESLSSRLSQRKSISKFDIKREIVEEQRIFSTEKIKKAAHIYLDTSLISPEECAYRIKSLALIAECKKCINTSANPSISIRASGLCDICENYERNFNKKSLQEELSFLLSLKGSGGLKYDALVGISGGKDSTATLWTVQKMGFKPLAFSLDTGYYPKHIFSRAKHIAEKLNADYARVDIRKHIRPEDRACFKKTADLYSKRDSVSLEREFKKWYAENRRHYSVKCTHEMPFVRTCQLCRRLVVRAYYAEAKKHTVKLVILGINEWTGLSQDPKSKKVTFSGIRKLRPFKGEPPIYIVHLPFLLQRKSDDTRKILSKIGWKIPKNESFIESNANSCLFAKAAEDKARRMLGFHPDETRLAREVTAGFLTKNQAKRALKKTHHTKKGVKRILMDAGII